LLKRRRSSRINKRTLTLVKWIYIRCRLRNNRPEFNTDDWRAIVKRLQDYADSKKLTKRQHPVGPLEYKMVADRMMVYGYNRYGIRFEFAVLQRIETDD
jgi:hypothetical protein